VNGAQYGLARRVRRARVVAHSGGRQEPVSAPTTRSGVNTPERVDRTCCGRFDSRRRTNPAPEVRSHPTSSRGCCCLGCGTDGLGKQRANRSFSTTVVTLTDLRVANLAGAIDEVHGRPVPVSVRVPSDEVVVQSDGLLELVLPHGTLDVLNGPLE
jgi:hypothetical protein